MERGCERRSAPPRGWLRLSFGIVELHKALRSHRRRRTCHFTIRSAGRCPAKPRRRSRVLRGRRSGATEAKARQVLSERMSQVGLELNPDKTLIV
jgi:hypothetical protein